MTYSSINSKGVPITGGSYPEALQTASIFGLITAFAICLQFQVSR